MVDDRAQLYTIEGLIAGLIMLATAYLVLGTPVSFAVGSSHISGMQLEQLGSDALAMMDTADTYDRESELQEIISTTNSTWFEKSFRESLERSTGATVMVNDLSFNATVYYHVDDEVLSYHLSPEPPDEPVGREPSVCVSRWVGMSAESPHQVMLLEVLIWRG